MKKENFEKKDNASGLEEEPSFNIHKMPKGYKVGRFNMDENDSSIVGNNQKKSSAETLGKNKKIGVIIVSLGVVIVLFLGYLIFSYIKNPDFSLSSIFNFNNKDLQEDKALTIPPAPPIPSDNIIIETPPDEDLIDEADETDETDEDLTDEDLTDEDLTDEDLVDEDLTEESIVGFIDSDSDGLSDQEELLLNTDFSSSDSDGDGYDDLTEVLNLYDPISDGLLIKNKNISKYNNEYFSYSILHPVIWNKSVLSDESSVIFSIDESSFIQILVEKNDKGVNIKNWYTSRFFTLVDSSKVIEKNGWEGVYSEDGLAFYLTDHQKSNIYTILYSSPENQSLIYINIFKMIINSFLADLSNF